jgi:hypothetical protein
MPDDTAALPELTTAIDNRDRTGDPLWRIDEFNRAVARNRLELTQGTGSSDDKTKG